MNKQVAAWYWLLGFSVLLSFSSFAEQTTEAMVDELFAGYTNDSPGVSVAVVKDGNIVLSKSYGLANLEYSVPITSQTVFNVGSVSKQFTAFAIYLLADKGKLSLDDDIRMYLPEMHDFGKSITIKHLLYHTSGIKEPLALLGFAGWRMDDYISTEQVLQLLGRQTSLNFETGTDFRYSNANYVLLAEIVSRISGVSFADFAQKAIFEPLGMQHSQFYDDNEKLIKNRAYSYDFEEGQYKKEKLNASYVGSTGLYTTADDLVKWSANFKEPTVGSKTLIETFNAPATLDDGTPALLSKELNIQHAKGQFFRNYRGVETYIHTGGDAFFRAFLGRFPNRNLTIVVVSNSPDFVAFPAGMSLLEIFEGDNMSPKLETTPTPQVSSSAPKRKVKNDSVRYEGTFYSEALLSSFEVKEQSDQLWLHHFRLGDIPLQAKPEYGTFSGRNYYPFTLSFDENKRGEVQAMIIKDFRGETLRFEKVSGKR